MQRSRWMAVLLGVAVVVLSSTGVAEIAACGCYCGKVLRPPCSDAACKQACGWRGPSTGTSSSSGASSSSSTYNYEAERQRQEAERLRRLEEDRQRQRETEEQRRRDEEEAKRRQQEFDKNKQQTLRDMKGIAGELGLKDAGTGDNPGLKGLEDTGVGSSGLKTTSAAAVTTTKTKTPACEWGNQDSAIVDLRCLGLDPDKPIVIDPHVVRGQERVFPAQIDTATFKNVNYNKGFEALMRFDVASAQAAVEYFKQAQLQRPRDPLVRNGLLLAQDILQARQQKEQEDKARAMQSLYHGLAALMIGDVNTANASVERARELDPANAAIARWAMTTAAMSANFSSPGREVKTVERLVGNAFLFEAWGNYAAEVRMMEMAKSLAPGNQYVAVVLDHARYLAAQDPALATTAPARK